MRHLIPNNACIQFVPEPRPAHTLSHELVSHPSAVIKMQLHKRANLRCDTKCSFRPRYAVSCPVLSSTRQPTTTSSLQQHIANCSIPGCRGAQQAPARHQRRHIIPCSAAEANVSVHKPLSGKEHLLLYALLFLSQAVTHDTSNSCTAHITCF